MLALKWRLKRSGNTFGKLKERAKEANPILRRWLGILKAEAKEQFADRAPPLAPATVARYSGLGTASVTAVAKVRQSYAKQLDRKLSGDETARQDLLAVLRGVRNKASLDSDNKTVDRLRRRLVAAEAARAGGRAIATGKKKIQGHVRGGKMARAFKGRLRGNRAVVENAVKFSKIHDTGGTVGNGASLPAWNFTEITQAVRDRLAAVALNFWLGKK